MGGATPSQTINGLHVEIAGSGDPVVLIHGFGLDARMWDDQFAVLARQYRVIRYDLRGYGRSQKPAASYSHTDDLAELLAHLSASPAHIVGISMGGRVAMRFALEYPALTKSLALIDAVIDGWSWSADWQERWGAIVTAAKRGDIAGARELWLRHPLFAPACERAGLAARLAEMVGAYTGWHWHEEDPGRGPKFPSANDVTAISVPTLVIAGERDIPDFCAIAEHLIAKIPGARGSWIPNAGHMSSIEDPRAVNALLLEHLSMAGSG